MNADPSRNKPSCFPKSILLYNCCFSFLFLVSSGSEENPQNLNISTFGSYHLIGSVIAHNVVVHNVVVRNVVVRNVVHKVAHSVVGNKACNHHMASRIVVHMVLGNKARNLIHMDRRNSPPIGHNWPYSTCPLQKEPLLKSSLFVSSETPQY
ncbi:MAG: hypothetical protein KR126chlam2_00592 [Chlamydiae bacterium]|nr:hypothetical protein [Chlamydiota bacterium]